jgi:hypothetical protein
MTVEIRPASHADLAALVAVLGQRHFFTDHLARQQRGDGLLLVAWLDGDPVGDGYLACEPAEEPEVRRYLPGAPRLEHLEVLGPFQGRHRHRPDPRGRGGRPAARPPAGRAGRGVDNPDARRLYERLGYADWGHGTIVGTWQDHDHDGPPVTVSETCDVLAKRL